MYLQLSAGRPSGDTWATGTERGWPTAVRMGSSGKGHWNRISSPFGPQCGNTCTLDFLHTVLSTGCRFPTSCGNILALRSATSPLMRSRAMSSRNGQSQSLKKRGDEAFQLVAAETFQVWVFKMFPSALVYMCHKIVVIVVIDFGLLLNLN